MAGERNATSFFVDTNHFDADQNTDALLTGQKWDTSSSNVITFSFIDSGGDLTYSAGVSFANQFSAVQQDAARRALEEFANVADVRFVEIGNDPGEDNANGAIRFADYTGLTAAFGYYPNSMESGGDLFFSDGSYESAPLGTYEFVTFLHELGHGMGLKHGHEASAGSGFPDVGSLEPERDGMEYSVMTYNSFIGQNLMPDFFANNFGHYAQTLMMYDIAALQRMYGPNRGHNGGDTVYTWDPATGQTFHNGTGQGVPEAPVIFRTEWDGGGTDAYDLSNFTTDLMIDLRPGMHSDFDVGGNQLRAQLNAGWDSGGSYVGASEHEYAAGHVYNALLFEGDEQSLIENANGGSGDDGMKGNVTGNVLRGNGGRDTLAGNGGNDTLEGGGGNDRIKGGAVSDTMRGGAGADFILGQNGGDVARGGQGSDTLIGNNGEDTLLSHGGDDSIKGGFRRDTIKGGAGNDTLFGQKGNDRVKGGADHDSLLGNNGRDTVLGHGGEDTLDGGYGHDFLKGGKGRDTLHGGGGPDTLLGGAGDDGLTGGNGPDIFRFNANIDSGVDTVTDFENGSDLVKLDGAVTFDDLTITRFVDTTIAWANGSVTLTGETGVIDADDFIFG